jgi:hypothetical protein
MSNGLFGARFAGIRLAPRRSLPVKEQHPHDLRAQWKSLNYHIILDHDFAVYVHVLYERQVGLTGRGGGFRQAHLKAVLHSLAYPVYRASSTSHAVLV